MTLIIVLLMIVGFSSFQSVKASSNLNDTLPDGAFDSSSLFLNDFLVRVFEYNLSIIDPSIIVLVVKDLSLLVKQMYGLEALYFKIMVYMVLLRD